MAARELAGPDERVEIVQHPESIELRTLSRVPKDMTEPRDPHRGGAALPPGSEILRSSVSLPLDGEGRVLVNWAGNRMRRRGGREDSFTHVPFGPVVEFYQKRYELLDSNVRNTVAQLTEEERKAVDADKYLKLSERFRQVLEGTLDMPPAEARALEDRMEKIREKMVAEFNAYLGALEKALPSITAPRAKERALKDIAKWREQVAAITAPDDFEKKLRPLVGGKLCLIGSASTASGDLHATPLGSSTPGMDVLANVANMALTGQVIRRAPVWVNFVYLFALGLLVSFFVTHWGTTASTAAALATAGGSAALFWVLFTGPAILIAGAGPIMSLLLTFAGVTAYKELVTQRSKRKLQRELEKNTSRRW
jgi:hypothetical protein